MNEVYQYSILSSSSRQRYPCLLVKMLISRLQVISRLENHLNLILTMIYNVYSDHSINVFKLQCIMDLNICYQIPYIVQPTQFCSELKFFSANFNRQEWLSGQRQNLEKSSLQECFRMTEYFLLCQDSPHQVCNLNQRLFKKLFQRVNMKYYLCLLWCCPLWFTMVLTCKICILEN